MARKLNKFDTMVHHLTNSMGDDLSNNRNFCIVTYAALGLVASFMTAMNVVTDKGFLTLATALFAVLCGANVILALFGTVAGRIAKLLFSVEVLAMFTFFLVSGNPEGFSAIWICMLPSIGMFFFNRFRGTVLCIAMFLIMVFFLWTPFGQSLLLFDYSEAFKMRFPVLFVAFHLVAYLLETLRINAFREMSAAQQHYRELSIRDSLTKMYNRQGMYAQLENSTRFYDAERIGALMFDIDYFKNINDEYGHNAGDLVLTRFSEILKANLSAVICRWGGEEFVAVFTDDDVSPEQIAAVKDLIAAETFVYENHEFHITVSVGVADEYYFDVKNIDTLIDKADQALYAAKNAGRNGIVFYRDLPKP